MRYRRLIILSLILLVGASDCARFNTWSNAKRFFREAEDAPLDTQGNVSSAARKKYDESIAKCQKLMDLYSGSDLVDDALYLMSRAYFMKEEYTRCLRRLDELDERFPEHEFQEEVLYLRGVCHLENEDESRAIAVLERLEENYPKSKHLAEGIFRSGEAEYNLGNWSTAIDAYQRLLSRFEKSEWNDIARLKIAEAQFELDEDSLAVETLRELADVAADRGIAFEAQMLQAEILLDQRRYEESRALTESLDEVAANFQGRPDLLLLNARIYEDEGDKETAVTLLENIAKEFPKSIYASEAWYRIGLIRQLSEGDLEEALRSYEQVEAEVPRGIFADLARSKKRAIQAFLVMQEGFEGADPDSSTAEMQFRLAENQFLRLESPTQAVTEYRKVLETYPDDPLVPAALYAIAFIQRYSLGDSVAAKSAADELLDRFPESEAAAFVKEWGESYGGRP